MEDKKIVDELRQIKQITALTAQTSKELLMEIKGLRRDINGKLQ